MGLVEIFGRELIIRMVGLMLSASLTSLALSLLWQFGSFEFAVIFGVSLVVVFNLGSYIELSDL